MPIIETKKVTARVTKTRLNGTKMTNHNPKRARSMRMITRTIPTKKKVMMTIEKARAASPLLAAEEVAPQRKKKKK